mgnify:FL=1
MTLNYGSLRVFLGKLTVTTQTNFLQVIVTWTEEEIEVTQNIIKANCKI